MLDVRVPGAHSLSDITFSEIAVLNPEPIRGGLVTPIDSSLSRVEVPAGSTLFVSGYIEGLSGRRGTAVESTDVFAGSFDWSTRQFELTTTILLEAGVELDLVLRAVFPNLPPVAEAGPDRIIECTNPEGEFATLTSDASTDPDSVQGQSNDLATFDWIEGAANAGFASTASGPELRLFVAPGQTRTVTLAVTDRSGSSSSDSVNVSVVDTTPPDVGFAIDGDCLPSDGELYLLTLGSELLVEASDACSGTTTTVVGASSDQLAGASSDVGFTEETVCLRGEAALEDRTYTVQIETVDGFGNVTPSTASLVVRSDGVCERPSKAPVVSDDDPRCHLPPAPVDCECRALDTRGQSTVFTTLALVAWSLRRRRRLT